MPICSSECLLFRMIPALGKHSQYQDLGCEVNVHARLKMDAIYTTKGFQFKLLFDNTRFRNGNDLHTDIFLTQFHYNVFVQKTLFHLKVYS